MKVIRADQDGFGHALFDYLEHGRGAEIVERDDGFIAVTPGPPAYFADFRRWPAVERKAIKHVRGRVLDIGCGAGRVALHLQERGHDIVAIDVSPLAVEVSARRGVRDARELSIDAVDGSLGQFDTIVMFGNNFGLLGSETKARRLLRRFHRLTGPDSRIVAASRDPYDTDDRSHVSYHDLNRSRGRMPGQVRLRVRYREHATPWFDYLLVSRDELDDLVRDAGWRVSRFIEPTGADYVAVIEKE